MSFLPLTIALQFMSGGHIALIVIAIVLLFGGKKIPELMKGLGQGLKEFKNAKDGVTDEKKEEGK